MFYRIRPRSFGLAAAFDVSLLGVVISGVIVWAFARVTAPHHPHPHPAILPSFYTNGFLMVPWEISFQTAFFELGCTLAAIGAFYASWKRGYLIVLIQTWSDRRCWLFDAVDVPSVVKQA